MSDQPHSHAPLPGHGILAYQAGAIRVVIGANLGDPIGGAEACIAGDVYRLKAEARARRLILNHAQGAAPIQTVAAGSVIGVAGDKIWPMAILTLMSSEGERLAIVTVWHEASETTFALPLSPMQPRLDYTLVDIDRDTSQVRLADVICVSFAAGTRITLPGGAQQPIETLKIGAMVLTRDNGPQPVRWLGKATLRATGSFAPVVISSGTLGNSGDLVVSPHHRLFIYQRSQRRLSGAAEIMVQAKHLIDGDRVWRREGGFVDYYSLVFDAHEIIFAEGIACESLMVTDDTVRLLPPELSGELQSLFPGLKHSPHTAPEVGRAVMQPETRAQFFHKDPK